MSLFNSLYTGASFVYADADFGTYPNMKNLTLGSTVFTFPAGTNPTALGSATPQDFANSVAALIDGFLTTKVGAGNFTPTVLTYTTDGTTGTLTFDNSTLNNTILFQPNGSASLVGVYDKSAARIDEPFSMSFFTELTPGDCATKLLNCPESYDHEIWNRLRNSAG